MSNRLTWGHSSLQLEFEWSDDSAVALSTVTTRGEARLFIAKGLPLVEVLTVAEGHSSASSRLVHTVAGEQLRYVSHDASERSGLHRLDLRLARSNPALEVVLTLTSHESASAFSAQVSVSNRAEAHRQVLRSVTSFSTYLGSAERDGDESDWQLTYGRGDWLAEGRWQTEPLRELLPSIEAVLTGNNPRGRFVAASRGAWSTSGDQPIAILSSLANQRAWAWEIQHNGGWRWEVGEDNADFYFAASGPTDQDHQWTAILEPGQSFTTVPVTIAISSDITEVVGELTTHRRLSRRAHDDNRAMPPVYNDYMNTINGDPTTEKLVPLIEAAAAVGAKVFCIDAGWYDDNHDWWDSVGEWVPSTTRFTSGLGAVIERIRNSGMVPGLWIEPEVIGVKSSVAALLPDAAFLSRNGQRVVEQGRYHLDLRSPAAISHLDSVVDRLVSELGIGYFKLDYNIDPGAGTDTNADSVGAGLLAHNRAHLAWIDSVLDRHPLLVLENCASGAMRMDFAMLSRLQLQSTSDQQDPLLYPPIAASAPISMVPEQAANWAYPQPTMTDEEIAFTLATTVLGRFYLSGWIDQMSDHQRAIVREALELNTALSDGIRRSTPFWPLGLPAWDSRQVALGLAIETSRYVTIWNRSEEGQELILDFADLTGADVTVRTVFPTGLVEWITRWDPDTGTLRIQTPAGQVGARILHLAPASAES
jgi:alpha-galactosidase